MEITQGWGNIPRAHTAPRNYPRLDVCCMVHLSVGFLWGFLRHNVLPCGHDLCQSCEGLAHGETICSPEATLQLYSGVDNTINGEQPYDTYTLHAHTHGHPYGNTKSYYNVSVF